MVWPGGRAGVLDCVPCQWSGSRPGPRVRVEEGTLARGELVTAEVDAPRRAATARHHSATHLLHKALRETLGEAAVQRGSLVTPDHATFDFSFPRALTPDELLAVERRLNRAVRDNLERTVAEMPVAEARATGAMALFDEKYGDVVRVVDFGGWARELCGGTHVARSGDIGAALIVAETSIGQGTRRIELVAGEAAERRWEGSEALLRETARTLRARLPEVPERVAKLLEQNRELQRRPAAAGDGLSALVRAAEILTAGRSRSPSPTRRRWAVTTPPPRRPSLRRTLGRRGGCCRVRPEHGGHQGRGGSGGGGGRCRAPGPDRGRGRRRAGRRAAGFRARRPAGMAAGGWIRSPPSEPRSTGNRETARESGDRPQEIRPASP